MAACAAPWCWDGRKASGCGDAWVGASRNPPSESCDLSVVSFRGRDGGMGSAKACQMAVGHTYVNAVVVVKLEEFVSNLVFFVGFEHGLSISGKSYFRCTQSPERLPRNAHEFPTPLQEKIYIKNHTRVYIYPQYW